MASLLVLSPCWANFHTFVVEQLYSNAGGSVQFVVLHEAAGLSGQQFLSGHQLQTSGPGGTKTFTFPNDLPSGDTAGRRALIATSGFAALGIVTPDYVVPDGFLPLANGTVNFAGVSQLNYAALPTDGVNALYRGGQVAPNVATNFAGQAGSVQPPPPPIFNFQGIWWRSPAESESGWGINFAHQRDTIFATWFTYDARGRAWWLSVTAQKTGTNTYSGDLYETNGPAFNAVPFSPAQVTASRVGTATLTFADANNGTFAYNVEKGGTVSQSKSITRQVFGALPTCTFGGLSDLALATNYQDLWWKSPAGSESGWGINFNHQGDTIFATWFTYDLDGSPLWLSATANKTGPGTYGGALYRTTGPAYNSTPFDPTTVVPAQVGSLAVVFADGNNGTLTYTVKLSDMPAAITQSKAITRQVFAVPGTACQ